MRKGKREEEMRENQFTFRALGRIGMGDINQRRGALPQPFLSSYYNVLLVLGISLIND